MCQEQRLIQLGCAGALLLAAGAARAEFYLGGAGGIGSVDSPAPITTLFFDDLRFGVRVAGGYRFNQHFGIEAMHLNFGSSETYENGSRRTYSSEQGTGFGAVVGAGSPRWRFDARFGVMQASAKFENRSSSQVPIGGSTKRSTQPWWGVSSAWLLSSPVTLQLEYTRTKFEYGFPLNGSGRAALLVFGAYYRF